jgi:hypothetical protein
MINIFLFDAINQFCPVLDLLFLDSNASDIALSGVGVGWGGGPVPPAESTTVVSDANWRVRCFFQDLS